MMKYKKIIAFFAMLALVVAVALATPPAGIIFNNILSKGVASDELGEKVKIDDWKVSLQTKGSSDFYIQDVAIAPGGYSGWHTHPGVYVGTVLTGSIDFYDENCNLRTFTVGDVWTENDKLHAIANHGNVDTRMQFAYLVKHDHAKRCGDKTYFIPASFTAQRQTAFESR
jgi:quercetin dioxygenase-like cupin family protein